MDGALVLGAALALSSLGACLIGVRRGLPVVRLRHAGGRALDCIGLGLVFLGANLMLGMAMLLGIRLATREFVSLYVLDDVTVLLLSLLQGLIAQWWWEEKR